MWARRVSRLGGAELRLTALPPALQIKTRGHTITVHPHLPTPVRAYNGARARSLPHPPHRGMEKMCSAAGFPSRMGRGGGVAAAHGPDTECLQDSAVLSVPLPTAHTRVTLNKSNDDHIPTHKGVALRDAYVPASDGVHVTPDNNRVYLRGGVTLPADVPADVRVTVPQQAGTPEDVYAVTLPPRLAGVLDLALNGTELDVTLSPWASAPNLMGMLREWTARAGPMHLHGVADNRVVLLDFAAGVTQLTANAFRVELSTATVLAPNGMTEAFSGAVSTAAATAALSTGQLATDADLAAVLTAGFNTPARRIAVQYGRDSTRFSLRVSAAAGDTAPLHRARITGSLARTVLHMREFSRSQPAGRDAVVFMGAEVRAGDSEYITLPTGRLDSTADVVAALQAAFDAQRALPEPDMGVPVTHGHAEWGLGAANASQLGFDVIVHTAPGAAPTTASIAFNGGPLTQPELVQAVQNAVDAAVTPPGTVAVSTGPDGHGVQFSAPGTLTVNFDVPAAGSRTAGVLGYTPSNAVIVASDGTVRPNAETLHVWRNAVTGAPLQAPFTVAQRTAGGALLVAAHTAYPTRAVVASGGTAAADHAVLEFTYTAGALTGATPGTRVVFSDTAGDLAAGVVLGELPDKSAVQVLAYAQINDGDTANLRSAERVAFALQLDPTAPKALPPTVLGLDGALLTPAAGQDAYGIGAARPLVSSRDLSAAASDALFTRGAAGEARLHKPPALLPPAFLYMEVQVAGQVVGDVVQADAPEGRPRARMLAVLPYDRSRHAYASPGVNAFMDYFPTPRNNAQYVTVRLLDDTGATYHPCRGTGVAVLDLL